MNESYSTPKLILIDAMAMIFRSHHVFSKNPRVTSGGLNTSAVFGFALSLTEVIQKENPTHIGVAFESISPTFRHIEYPAYKAQREATPEDIKTAIPMVMELLEALKIPILQAEGFEADDVIGTLAVKAGEQGITVYMLTPDKDFAQVVRERIYLYRISSKNEAPYPWDAEEVEKQMGVRPDQIADYLGLRGDAVDNIPGVPKIGEKTAISLLKEFGSMESVLQNVESVSKASIRASLLEFHEQARLSKHLATIALDVPIELDLQALEICEPDVNKLTSLLHKWEFRSLAKKLLPEIESSSPDLFSNTEENSTISEKTEDVQYESINDRNVSYRKVETPEEIREMIARIKHAGRFSFDTETTSIDAYEAQLVAMSFACDDGEAYFISFPDDRDLVIEKLNQLKDLFQGQDLLKIVQNMKYDLAVLKNYGYEVFGPIYDTMLAHYLAHSEARHNLDVLAIHYLNYKSISFAEMIKSKGKTPINIRDVPEKELLDYACEDADVTFRIQYLIHSDLIERSNPDILFNIEQPVARVLETMERNGIKVDAEFLDNYALELEKEIDRISHNIYQVADKKFNLNSPRQLGELLFDQLKLSPSKKTKTGQYSTNEAELTKLAAKGYEIPSLVLEYRHISKLKSTYVDTLPKLIHPQTGRVHTSFNQAVAVTGRLSSNNPNLQNIPVKTEMGREIRKAFVAQDPETHVLLSADYSQIELRVIAALSKDEVMCNAFVNNLDIHRSTAARVFGVSEENVDSDMRRKAKMVNFGLIYGISAFGLAERLGIGRREAGELIETYFREYKGIKRYMDECIDSARQKGYAETLFGRRHYLRNLNSKNPNERGYAERNAINTPIQGTAAELMKLAMIRVHNRMSKENMKSLLILQVHDELLFDALRSEVEQLRVLVIEEMSQAYDLGVPLVVDTGIGDNWLEAH